MTHESRGRRGALVIGAVFLLAGARFGSTQIELSLDEGTNFALTLAPDDSRLVIDLQGTLWSLPTEGGEGRPLTDGLGDDRSPDWSPDGSRIVFQSYRHGTWDIWSIGADGSGLEQLTRSSFDDREPVWSPDGDAVAFSSDRSGNYDIWILDIETRELTQLTRNPANDTMPEWSPDSAFVAFISSREQAGTTALWTIRIKDGLEEEIVAFDGQAASPSWNRDGQRIALQLLERRTRSDLVVVTLDDGGMTRLSSGRDVFPFRPAWTKDGGVLFTADGRIQYLPADNDETLSVPFHVRVTLGRPNYERRKARLPQPGERLAVRGIVRPLVSPDGSSIAFTALGDLWTVSAEGGTPMPLTRDEALDSDPCWAPDGNNVVFSSDREGTMDLWVKEIAAGSKGGERRLTDLPGAEIGPAWSPDGRSIAFLDETDTLYVMDAEGGAPRPIYRAHGSVGLPSWSSDSRHIALADLRQVSTRFREGRNRILVISTDSGTGKILDVPGKSFGTRDGDGPVWSPDGQKLAFAMDAGLWVLPVTPSGEPAGEARQVAGEPADFMSWFPDSTSLLYLASGDLKRVDVDGGTPRVLPLSLAYRIPGGEGKMLIRGARLIDGTGAPPRDNVDITIEGNRITGVAGGGAEPAEGVRIIDASGQTVIPGIIESHTHLDLPQWGSRHGRVWLAYGVTTVRTLMTLTQRALDERESIDSGRRTGPRMFVTGFGLDGDRVYYEGSLAIEDEKELREELSRAFRLEYDLIKTYVRLPDTLQRTVIEEAHRQGAFVTSHEIYPAVAYGIDGIEHVSGTSRRRFSPKVTALGNSYGDVVDLISRSGVYFTPTLVLGGFQMAAAREPEFLEDPRLKNLHPPWDQQRITSMVTPSGVSRLSELEARMKPRLATVAAIARRGGKILAGTDSPLVPCGLATLVEIELLSEAGLGPLAAIRSATQLAAEALGAGDDLGTVEPGKLADLVILSGDPTEDIRNIRKTDKVILNGRLATVGQLLREGR